ncbi:DUF1254 domain-containing protein [Mangrovicoccus sp. HB161399]|uniref:DUF1254 domain-containing protein n=1 Tax=Mangrovicoccus sp. HB161399 TaxID=2720392 RepID=UPI001553565F|nr:DUF1254 domain-containing protein [Mangrovicoccus sp. HB161399]
MDKRTFLLRSLASAAAGLALAASSARAQAPDITPGEARAIARDAYVYGYPLVENYRIQYTYFVDGSGAEYKGPWNTLINIARLYTPEDTAIQTPNSDTPYSMLGADLRAGPLVLRVPEIEKGRYYSLQFIDAYTFNFDYVGSRTTGNGGGTYLLAGPGWSGDAPAGIDKVLRSETEFALVIYRTQMMGPDDLDNVKKIQSGYGVQPLAAFLGQSAAGAEAPPLEKPNVLPTRVTVAHPVTQALVPVAQKEERTDPKFFEILDLTLKLGPVPEAEKDIRAEMARLGIGTEAGFDAAKLPPEILAAVKAGMSDAWDAFGTFKKTQIETGKVTSADLFGTRAKIGGNWMYRMAAVILGIYGNSPEEALYPALQVDSGGQGLSGANAYTVTFPKGQLPPVKAFWSVTMYDLPQSLLVANPIKRYLINSPMLPGLAMDDDGSLTIYVQNQPPGDGKESNWLPAPEGPFWMALRLYWPDDAALKGEWTAPKVVKAH